MLLRSIHRFAIGRRLPLTVGKRRYSAVFSKYEHRIKARAEEKGLTPEQLKEKALKEHREKIIAENKERQREAQAQRESVAAASAKSASEAPAAAKSVRNDSSPVKPLSSILNLPRILSATPEQVSALWTAYHASRSDGTGRGYLCATVPYSAYEKMSEVAGPYPTFIIPLERPAPPDSGESNSAYEFFLLQWSFHEKPPKPTAEEDPFVIPNTSDSPNPRISTALFTPLQEYKLRQSFATPYLVLTHYTDLVHTHGIVLLRGEITPSRAASAGDGDGHYLLSQADAQALSVNLQKFYLWEGKGQSERQSILRSFHEKPEEFNWEELLKHTAPDT